MHIAFLNPQGNFDPQDRYWTAHADFGGQLVYVKEVALALGRMGHKVDILARRIVDPDWEGFESELDAYPGEDDVRIVRLSCGGEKFLRKENLWPWLGTEWVPNIVAFYDREGAAPAVATTHYGDGGLAGALWQARGGPPFTFTGHSLGAQKLERLLAQGGATLAELDGQYHFARRLVAERTAMSHAGRVVTSTRQERFEQYAHSAYRGAIDPADDARFAVIPPGVNLRIFDADRLGPHDAQIADYLERMIARDIDADRASFPAVIASSRLDPKKNLEGLVRAFATSQELQAKANLLLVARGVKDARSREGLTKTEAKVLDAIQALADEAGLWGKLSVFSLESQDELAAAYRHLRARRSIFALAALYEPFGLAPLEAMAAGLPAVVTRNGGPSESLREGEQEFGVLVDPSDPQDIARGLLRLVNSAREWARMQRAGRERVLSRYTWDRTAAGYFEVLGTLRAPASRLPIPAYFINPTANDDPDITTLWPGAAD